MSTFQAEIDGKIIKSVLKEKQKAEEQFDDAIASGHDAFKAEHGEQSFLEVVWCGTATKVIYRVGRPTVPRP